MFLQAEEEFGVLAGPETARTSLSAHTKRRRVMNASDFVDRYWNLSVDADVPNAPFHADVSINKY